MLRKGGRHKIAISGSINQFIQPLPGNAGFAVESTGHLPADRCGRVGVIAEVGGF